MLASGFSRAGPLDPLRDGSLLTGDVETFYTVPGQLELQLNRDPAIQQERQKQQVKSLKDRQGEVRK